jgi:hypothetical protein
LLDARAGESRFLVGRGGQQRIFVNGLDHPAGQRAIASMGEEGPFGHDRKLVPAQFFVGMEFGDGHASGEVRDNGFATKCIARIYTGTGQKGRQFTALV